MCEGGRDKCVTDVQSSSQIIIIINKPTPSYSLNPTGTERQELDTVDPQVDKLMSTAAADIEYNELTMKQQQTTYLVGLSVFNCIFSTNRLYHATGLWNILCRAGDKTNTIK